MSLLLPNKTDRRIAVALGLAVAAPAPAALLFDAAASYETGFWTRGVVVADFTDDGAPDVAVINRFTTEIAVLASDGLTGAMHPAGAFAAGALPRIGVAADLDNDGLPDLAIAASGIDRVSVLRNMGRDGGGWLGFEPFVLYDVGPNPHWVDAADFNADGLLDLIVANYGDSNAVVNTVSVLFGLGGGAFAPHVTSPVSLGARPIAVSVADVNGDGWVDAMVVDERNVLVRRLLNSGLDEFGAWRGFTNDVTVSVGLRPRAIAASDFNGDGSPDFAIANFNSGSVSVLLNTGDGGFTAQSVQVGSNPEHAFPVDLDSDGVADLATACLATNEVYVLLGVGDGSFVPAATLPVGPEPKFVGTGDFDGNGRPDLAVAIYNGGAAAAVDTMLNQSTGPGYRPGDFNADGAVAGGDLAYMLGLWASPASLPDLNFDGAVDGADLSILLGNWGGP